MTLINDQNAEERSLMNRAPCICDGEKTGIPCKHFWSLIQKFAANNADSLRSGEKQRACTVADSFFFEFTYEEKPTFCNRYEKRKSPGLVSILKRSVGLGGYEKFNKSFETFNPMTVEEIEQLRKDNPDKPVQWSHGIRPDRLSAHDIMTGPQIGILKPGEKIPGVELAEEAERALDGIFGVGVGGGDVDKKGNDGIFTNKGGDG